MRCDAMRCDAMRCDAMRCDAMRCDAMRCDAMRRKDTIKRLAGPVHWLQVGATSSTARFGIRILGVVIGQNIDELLLSALQLCGDDAAGPASPSAAGSTSTASDTSSLSPSFAVSLFASLMSDVAMAKNVMKKRCHLRLLNLLRASLPADILTSACRALRYGAVLLHPLTPQRGVALPFLVLCCIPDRAR
jgi:hypothetical protein